MQPIVSSSSDTSLQTGYNKQASAANIATSNVSKLENKPTQSVNASNKADAKNIAEQKLDKQAAILADSKAQAQTTQKAADDVKKQAVLMSEKKLDKNLAKEKMLDSAANKEASKATATLEAKKSYTENTTHSADNTDKLTASEVASQKQDILESVKSVKPDGTETYYFPVPVEVLTQLPPPGNLGLSEKMLDDIMNEQTKKADAKPSDSQNIMVSPSGDDVKKIYLETTKQIDAVMSNSLLNSSTSNTGNVGNTGNFNAQPNAPSMDYGIS